MDASRRSTATIEDSNHCKVYGRDVEGSGGRFTCGVLSQQKHRGLGVEIRLVQIAAKKVSKLVGFFQRSDLRTTHALKQ